MRQPAPPLFSPLRLGRYALSESAGDTGSPAQALRALCFRAGASDRDDLDAQCRHFVVTEQTTTVAAFRLLILPAASDIARSYSARFYDLSRLSTRSGAAMELGRFCLHPDWHDPDILRLAWAGLTRLVDACAIELLFGCSSFQGTDPAPHLDALAHLARRHLAPDHSAPQRKGAALDYPALAANHPDTPKAALAAMPPLLRTYLAMGGWVSDHAVVDHDLSTLHVFTGVEISRIPPARARLLRALAGAVADSTNARTNAHTNARAGDSVIDLPARSE